MTRLLALTLILLTQTWIPKASATTRHLSVEMPFHSLCGKMQNSGSWSVSKIRYLQENNLFPHGNAVNVKFSLNGLKNYEAMLPKSKHLSEKEFAELLPLKVTRARTALATTLSIRNEILKHQNTQLQEYKTILQNLINCSEEGTHCDSAKEFVKRFNEQALKAGEKMSANGTATEVHPLRSEDLILYIQQRILRGEERALNQTDSEIFLDDNALLKVYVTLNFNTSDEQTSLYCSVSRAMRFNTSENERMKAMANLYLDAVIHLGVGTAGTMISLTVFKGLRFLYRVVPTFGIEFAIQQSMEQLLKLIRFS